MKAPLSHNFHLSSSHNQHKAANASEQPPYSGYSKSSKQPLSGQYISDSDLRAQNSNQITLTRHQNESPHSLSPSQDKQYPSHYSRVTSQHRENRVPSNGDQQQQSRAMPSLSNYNSTETRVPSHQQLRPKNSSSHNFSQGRESEERLATFLKSNEGSGQSNYYNQSNPSQSQTAHHQRKLFQDQRHSVGQNVYQPLFPEREGIEKSNYRSNSSQGQALPFSSNSQKTQQKQNDVAEEYKQMPHYKYDKSKAQQQDLKSKPPHAQHHHYNYQAEKPSSLNQRRSNQAASEALQSQSAQALSGMIVSKDEYIYRTSEERKNIQVDSKQPGQKKKLLSPEKSKSSRHERVQDRSSPSKEAFEKISPIKNPNLKSSIVQKSQRNQRASTAQLQTQKDVQSNQMGADLKSPPLKNVSDSMVQNLKSFNNSDRNDKLNFNLQSKNKVPAHFMAAATSQEEQRKLSEKYSNMPVQNFQIKSFDVKKTDAQCSFGQPSQDYSGLNNLHKTQMPFSLLSPTHLSNSQGFSHFQPQRPQVNYQPPLSNHSRSKGLFDPPSQPQTETMNNFSSNGTSSHPPLSSFSLMPSSGSKEPRHNQTAQPSALMALLSSQNSNEFRDRTELLNKFTQSRNSVDQQLLRNQALQDIPKYQQAHPQHSVDEGHRKQLNKSSPSKIVRLKVTRSGAGSNFHSKSISAEGEGNPQASKPLLNSSEGVKHLQHTNQERPEGVNAFQRQKMSVDASSQQLSSQTLTLFQTHKPLFQYLPSATAPSSRKLAEPKKFDRHFVSSSAEFNSAATILAQRNQALPQNSLFQTSSRTQQQKTDESEKLKANSYLLKTQNLNLNARGSFRAPTSSLGSQNILVSANLSASGQKINQQLTPQSHNTTAGAPGYSQFVLTPKDFYHGSQKAYGQSRDSSYARENVSGSLVVPENAAISAVLQRSNNARQDSSSLSRSNNNQQHSVNRTQFSIARSQTATTSNNQQNPSFANSQTTVSNPYQLPQHSQLPLTQLSQADSFLRTSQNRNLMPFTNSVASQSDMEFIIMGLHEKMKNLENKYLDLANYYKREMVKRSAASSSLSFFPSDQHRPSANAQQVLSQAARQQSAERSVSPIRIDNYFYSPLATQTQNPQPSLPASRERDIISELLNDKQELEVALQNMLELQNVMQEKHVNLQSRLKYVEKERSQRAKHELKGKEKQRLQEATSEGRSLDQRNLDLLVEELHCQITQSIEQIENNLLLVVSSGYQQLSEGDLIDHFANLKIEVEKLVDSLRSQLQRIQSSRLSVTDLQTLNPTFAAAPEQLTHSPRQLMSPRQRERTGLQLQELEMRSDYNQQLQQKAIFELMNSHNLSKLEVRKIQIAVQQTQKLAKEIKQEVITKTQGSSDFRLLDHLSQQVLVISACSQGLSERYKDSDAFLGQLQDSEVVAAANFKELREKCDQLLQKIAFTSPREVSAKIQSNQRSSSHNRVGDQPIMLSPRQKVHENLKAKLKELKYQNADLQDQIALKSLDIQQLEGQNKQFLQRMSDLEQQLTAHLQLKSSTEENEINSSDIAYLNTRQNAGYQLSPHSKRLLFDYEGEEGAPLLQSNQGKQFARAQEADRKGQHQSEEKEQLYQEIERLETHLETIGSENEGLVKQIRVLHRTINEKNDQLEILAAELRHQASQGQDYSSSDQLRRDLKAAEEMAVRLASATQSFLSAMKRLQRAVHNQQPSVSEEKNNFEKSRKELESIMKQAKRTRKASSSLEERKELLTDREGQLEQSHLIGLEQLRFENQPTQLVLTKLNCEWLQIHEQRLKSLQVAKSTQALFQDAPQISQSPRDNALNELELQNLIAIVNKPKLNKSNLNEQSLIFQELLEEKEFEIQSLKQAEQSMAQRIAALETKFKALTRQDASKQSQNLKLSQQILELQTQMNEDQVKIATQATELSHERKQCQSLKADLKKSKEAQGELIQTSQDLKQALEALKLELTEAESNLEQQSQAIQSLEEQLKDQTAHSELKLQTEKQKLQAEINRLKQLKSEVVTQSEAIVLELETQAATLTQGLSEATEKNKQLEASLKVFKQQDDVVRQDLRKVENEARLSALRVADLENELANQRELESELQKQLLSQASQKTKAESALQLQLKKTKTVERELAAARDLTSQLESNCFLVAKEFEQQKQISQLSEEEIQKLRAEKESAGSLYSQMKSQLEMVQIENANQKKQGEELLKSLNQHQSQNQLEQEVHSVKDDQLRRLDEEIQNLKSQLQSQLNLKNEALSQEQKLLEEIRQLKVIQDKKAREQKNQILAQDQEIQELEALIRESDSQARELQTQLDESQVFVEDLRAVNNQQKEKISASEAQIEELRKKLLSQTQSSEENQQQLESQIENLRSKVNKQGELKNLAVQLEAATLESEDLRNQLIRKEEEIAKLNRALQTFKDQFLNLQSHQMSGKSDEEELNLKLSQKTQEASQLREQVKTLRNQFEEKLVSLDEQNTAKDIELAMQKELVDDAKKLIEEVQTEKEQLKSRLRALMELLDRDGGNSGVDRSPEAELHTIPEDIQDDPDLDIEHCLDRLEAALVRTLTRNTTSLKQLRSEKEKQQSQKEQIIGEKEELETQAQGVQKKCEELETQLGQALTKLQTNDQDFRKQLELATRKVQNYRDKVIQKQKQINCLEQEKRELQQSKVDIMLRSGVASPVNNSTREIELLQRLQRAEAELQTYRLAGIQTAQNQAKEQKRGGSRGRGSDSGDEASIKVDESRIEQMEDQLQTLRGLLFTAKEEVTQKLTEVFAKQVKEIARTFQSDKILANRLNSLTSDQQLKAVFNNQFKVLKILALSSPTDRKLLILQNVSSQELAVIDTDTLTPALLSYLLTYLPQNAAEVQLESIFSAFGVQDGLSSPNSNLKATSAGQEQGIAEVERQLARLEEKVAEIREERQELQQELAIYRNKLLGGKGFEGVDLEVIEREDDIDSLNDKNQQMRIKIKELAEDNLLLKHRLIEQNELLKAFATPKSERTSAPAQAKQSTNTENAVAMKLRDENDQLKFQLSELEQQNEELQAVVEQLQLQLNPQLSQNPAEGRSGVQSETEILRHQNQVLRKFTDQDFQELNEGSFLNGIGQAQVYGVEEAKTSAQAKAAVNQFLDSQNYDEGANDMFDQSSLYGVILDGIEGKGAQPENAGQKQTQNKQQTSEEVRRVRLENEELRAEIGSLQHLLDKLETQNGSLNAEIKALQGELRDQEQQLLLNPDSTVMLSNIKGTLLQYLRSCPLSDKMSEPLLEVVMSQMGYSKEEVEDLKSQRRKGRDASLSGSNTNHDDDTGSRSRKPTGGAIGGLFGNLLRRKDGGSKEQSMVRESSKASPSPMRPIQRK